MKSINPVFKLDQDTGGFILVYLNGIIIGNIDSLEIDSAKREGKFSLVANYGQPDFYLNQNMSLEVKKRNIDRNTWKESFDDLYKGTIEFTDIENKKIGMMTRFITKVYTFKEHKDEETN